MIFLNKLSNKNVWKKISLHILAFQNTSINFFFFFLADTGYKPKNSEYNIYVLENYKATRFKVTGSERF